MAHRKVRVACLLVISLAIIPIWAGAENQRERLSFPQGQGAATRQGRIRGYDVKDYLLQARAGQRLTIHLQSQNIYTYAVIFIKKGESLENLTPEEKEWSGVLQETGDYVIRVLMLRAGARKEGAKADYTLEVAVR